MKHINKARISLPLIIVILSSLQLACSGDKQIAAWDGHWQRRVHVPKDVQGRCIDEKLIIDKKIWQLTAVVHSSYDCNQPFLELTYAGVLEEVRIKRQTEDRHMFLQIRDIQLSGLADLGAGGRKPLSSGTLSKLSSKYVPEQYHRFEQAVVLSADRQQMASVIYRPLQDLAIPAYPEGVSAAEYQRQP